MGKIELAQGLSFPAAEFATEVVASLGMRGGGKSNFPDLEPWELGQTCALDVADNNAEEGLPLEYVGDLLNLTRERVRQVELAAIEKCRDYRPRKRAA